MMAIKGNINLPKMDGIEISPGVYLIGEPIPRPDLGKTAMACLANVQGMLAVVQLSIVFKPNPKQPNDKMG
jgi:hypothetical protein